MQYIKTGEFHDESKINPILHHRFRIILSTLMLTFLAMITVSVMSFNLISNIISQNVNTVSEFEDIMLISDKSTLY
jgi:hypothetical protein